MKELDDLRAAVFEFLELGDVSIDVAHVGYDKVRAALDAAHAARPTLADAEALWAEIENVVRERYSMKFLSPLYPWGVVSGVKELPDSIRYEQLARDHEGPCNCELVRERKFYDRLRSDGFVKIAESDDFYERYIEYRCPHCNSVWRRVDSSTEQYSAWGWVPVSTDLIT